MMVGFLAALVLFLQGSVSAWSQVADPAPLDMNKIRVPPNFRISLFAQLPSAPRFMVFAPDGNLLVSLWISGQIARITPQGQVSIFASDLLIPHGLAFLGKDLYVGETLRVRVYRNLDPNRSEVVVQSLPSLGHHFSRTIGFGPDGKLYVSIGSSCNLCAETDPRRASIVRYNPDGTGQEVFASGLRNAVGFRWNPFTRELWATENGFDDGGDDLPPEEINIVRQGSHLGWPYCYADRFPNLLFPPPQAGWCAATVAPALLLTAHSAPLGLDFYTGSGFAAEYRGDAYVALHGSSFRKTLTGYKVVRVRTREGIPVAVEDFVTGWLDPDKRTASGRPVDLLTGPDGALYLSDDRANVIYRISYEGALLSPDGVANAASYSLFAAAAPGGLVSIFGRNLYGSLFQANSLPLPERIEGLAVTMGGLPAPIFYASPNQINVQVPTRTIGLTTLTVTTSNGNDSASLVVRAAAPGIFSQDSTGSGPGAIRNATRGVLVSTASPASQGDVLEIYATGLGATTEQVPAGVAAPLDRAISTRTTPTVLIGGVQAEMLFSGLAPGSVGLYQVNARVPSGVAPGPAVPLSLSLLGHTSNTVTLAIE